MNNDLLLKVNGVTKSYHSGPHRLPVLNGVELDVRAGESVAVTGLSGAGKSTLLHVLGGLHRPDAGQVRYRNEDIYVMRSGARTRWRARRIGFVFQSYHLLPEMDVLENVMLATRTGVRYSGGAAARERALCLLDAVGLKQRAHHTPQELSGGERQRVALARALVNEPEMILADEPTGNLDAETGRQVMNCLFQLVSRQGHSLVLVTHDPVTAALCHRRLVISDGRLHAALPLTERTQPGRE